MDFLALSPEINSARMYSGPGAGSLLAAAAAWDGLATNLGSAASSYQSVISGLSSGGWLGPASASMAAAAAPYVGWMSTTAAQAQQAATQAAAAASAYETAFAMTVPPPVIAANRAQLASLVSTNVLGQNTPAIATLEAQYGEMWAQDAAAMYGYASTAAAAMTTVSPFTTPAPTTNTSGLASQAGAVTQATGTSAGTSAATNASTTLSGLVSELGLGELTTPWGSTSSSVTTGIANLLGGNDTSALGTFLNSNLFTNTGINGIIAGGPFNPTGIIDAMVGLSALGAAAGASGPTMEAAVAPAAGAAAGALGSAGFPGLGAAAASAGLGRASLLGALSVPPSWSATVSPVAATALPGTGFGAAPMVGATPPLGMPGMPSASMAGHDIEEIPEYGFRPIVISRPLGVG